MSNKFKKLIESKHREFINSEYGKKFMSRLRKKEKESKKLLENTNDNKEKFSKSKKKFK